MAGPGRPKSALPIEELYTPALKGQLDEFRKLIQRKGWSERRAARALGCSATTVNRLLRYDFPGDVTGWCDKMRRLIARENTRRRMPKHPKFVKTSVAERVLEVLKLAHLERAIGLVLGSTGVGKTMAAREYLKKEPDTIYVVAGPGTSARPLLQILAAELGVATQGTILNMRRAIVDACQGSDRLIIVDEGDYMTEAALQTLRIIHDDGGIGLVIVCTPAYLEKMKERHSPTLQQFLGRIAYREAIDEAPPPDLKLIARQFGLGKDALAALIGGSAGSARRCRAALVAAQRTNGGTFSPGGIAEAFEQLMPVTLE